ncbi:hypothetical protein PMKS-003599 [Pichia membranifaciens]|uniref:Small ribosomal subunit protein mS23 n=1 Tax=Pichia membranifaciens TaxID=4926 RepID=A0A1Q2YL62_9ASCO|nr:hypothetical protein PMKS-003599 [Pichia membranifaciens]
MKERGREERTTEQEKRNELDQDCQPGAPENQRVSQLGACLITACVVQGARTQHSSPCVQQKRAVGGVGEDESGRGLCDQPHQRETGGWVLCDEGEGAEEEGRLESLEVTAAALHRGRPPSALLQTTPVGACRSKEPRGERKQSRQRELRLEPSEAAKFEYYRLKIQDETEMNVVREEGEMFGAVYPKTAIEEGFDKETEVLQKWKTDAVEQTKILDAKFSNKDSSATASADTTAENETALTEEEIFNKLKL